MHESTHLYSSKSLFLLDCSFTFSSSFSYSNSAIKEYYDRIWSCMNYLASYAVFSELLISSLMSSCLICEFCRTAQHFMNLLQCTMMCFAVSLIWSHGQTDDEKLRTWVLFRKTASSLQLMWICVINFKILKWTFIWTLTVYIIMLTYYIN